MSEAPAIEMVNFGCRLNASEAKIMRARAFEAGLTDAVIVNTCAVTNEAVRKTRQAIRKLKHGRPNARIVVAGCAAQLEPAAFAGMPEVDRVLGNVEKLEARNFMLGGERVRVAGIMSVKETASHLLDGFAVMPRAFVQVQNGCDHRCTFCIIPFARGPSRSVPQGAVVEEVRRLLARGAREIVLTGVDITAYGADLPGAPKLGRLVAQILKFVPELARLRLSSLDCCEADGELLELIAGESRVMPHIHLSLQAGDDMILKRMKRRHSRGEAIEFCARLRGMRRDIAFGADLIAGFPTETDAMFENTLRLVDECGLSYLHVFPFSARRGTPAARMPQVDGRIIRQRARTLREKGAAALARHLDAQIGRELEILVEEPGLGRAPDYAQVILNSGAQGEVLRARIKAHDGTRLIAA